GGGDARPCAAGGRVVGARRGRAARRLGGVPAATPARRRAPPRLRAAGGGGRARLRAGCRLRRGVPGRGPGDRAGGGVRRSLSRGRPGERGERVDPPGRRRAAAPADRPGPGLPLRRHRRLPAAGHPVERLVSQLPVLSLITAAPFAGAVLIMFTARRRPAVVRGIAVVTTGISLLLSLYVYWTYQTAAGGFQFYERYPLVPSLGVAVELGADGMSVL